MHHHNCNAVMELAHGGNMVMPVDIGNDVILIGPNDEVNAEGLKVRAMTDEDIHRVADCFADSAKLVKEAGLTWYLLRWSRMASVSLSPSMNRRR